MRFMRWVGNIAATCRKTGGSTEARGNMEVQLSDLYRAYRKAKYEAFRDKSHFSALAFLEYEKSLDRNLRNLQERLSAPNGKWWKKPAQIGGYLYCPKGLRQPVQASGNHWATLDPLVDWTQRCASKRAEAAFRLIITPTIDFHVISALWIMGPGSALDEGLNQSVSYGARLSRRYQDGDELGPSFNEDSLRLFTPYFSLYQEWRNNGLACMRRHLESGDRILAVTMDIRRFYHNIAPEFLSHPRLLASLGVSLSAEQVDLTRILISAIADWYASTPDAATRPEGGLPVGLSASRVISNLLLKEFDDYIIAGLSPLYYGRYVDDIFLVIRDPGTISEAGAFSSWFANAIRPIGTYQEGKAIVEINLSYSAGCRIEFVQEKQRIFRLEGEYGIDLLNQIEEQIKTQSSEYRLLPELEIEEGKFVAKSLLASSDRSVTVDALRKADSISLRRLEFSLLLRDLEAYERDLKPDEWKELRVNFFDVVFRHVITPAGFFDYSSYLYRAIGFGVACGDFDQVHRLLDRFAAVVKCLESTTTAGTTAQGEFKSCLKYYSLGFLQVCIQAATSRNVSATTKVAKVIQKIRNLSQKQVGGPAPSELGSIVKRILRADLGRRPYKDHWYYDNERISYQPSFTKHDDVLRALRLGAIRSFRKLAKRNKPHWPALAFPTRPISIAEIYLLAPGLFARPSLAVSVILALRGARLGRRGVPPVLENGRLVVPGKQSPIVKVAVTSWLITDEQWAAAVKGAGDDSLQRYMAIRRLVRDAMADPSSPNYIVFPECSIPAKWAASIATTLGMSGISFICGMENWINGAVVRNDALISLASKWAGYNCAVMVQQPKFQPAQKEKYELDQLGRTLYEPVDDEQKMLIYSHHGFRFGVLICSDLTNIDHRAFLRGRVDALMVLEWNPDLETFSGLVEATSYDLHAFMVQVNNRRFGDSRVRAPYYKRYQRDIVRVKGGDSDYYVIATLDLNSLRAFKLGVATVTGDPIFKPLPIGYLEKGE